MLPAYSANSDGLLPSAWLGSASDVGVRAEPHGSRAGHRLRSEIDGVGILTEHVRQALEHLPIPVGMVDRDGRFAWANRVLLEFVGNIVGHHFRRVVAPEHGPLAHQQFARKLAGATAATEYEISVLDRDGRRTPVRLYSVPICVRGEVVGMLGFVLERSEPTVSSESAPSGAICLTPRQQQVLALLAEALTTEEIAQHLGVALETARNHIRVLLRRLGCHSRLEVVVEARRRGLVP